MSAQSTPNWFPLLEDVTRAEATEERDLGFPPELGWRIERIVTSTEMSPNPFTYTDDDKSSDNYVVGGAVDRLTFMGDTDGDDVEQGTQVEISFAPVSVELMEVTDCVPPTPVP